MEYHALDPYPIPKEESPMDLNKKAIMRRLWRIICHYGEANKDNESDFRMDVDMLISQIEIYDQRWYVRHKPKEGNYRLEAIELVKEFVKELEQIPDGGAECFRLRQWMI